jgi:HAMP domain-containing protein
MSSTLFQTISSLLDEVQAALLDPNAHRVEQACKQLMEGLSAELGRHATNSPNASLSANEVEALAARFGQLRQQLAQVSAANERQLAILLPDVLPGPYGAKSVFGIPSRSANTKAYQA